MTKLIRITVLAALVAGMGVAVAGTASAMEFNPDACLDLSQVDVHDGGQEYHYVARPGTAPGECPEWVLVPKD